MSETDNLATVVDISPLVEGHLLVVPKKHYLNFAGAMLDYGQEALRALRTASEWVRETYGVAVLFEHGSTADLAGGACIAHAHVHVLPVGAAELLDVMRRDQLELTALPGISAWAWAGATGRPYLLWSDGERSLAAFPPAGLRQQYLRSAAAEVLGIPDPEWDWSLLIRRDLLRDTMRRYRGG